MTKHCSVQALKHGYAIELVEPDTPWRYDVNECTRRNSHQVTSDIVRSTPPPIIRPRPLSTIHKPISKSDPARFLIFFHLSLPP